MTTAGKGSTSHHSRRSVPLLSQDGKLVRRGTEQVFQRRAKIHLDRELRKKTPSRNVPRGSCSYPVAPVEEISQVFGKRRNEHLVDLQGFQNIALPLRENLFVILQGIDICPKIRSVIGEVERVVETSRFRYEYLLEKSHIAVRVGAVRPTTMGGFLEVGIGENPPKGTYFCHIEVFPFLDVYPAARFVFQVGTRDELSVFTSKAGHIQEWVFRNILVTRVMKSHPKRFTIEGADFGNEIRNRVSLQLLLRMSYESAVFIILENLKGAVLEFC